MENQIKEVYFNEYCEKCKYFAEIAGKLSDICDACLTCPGNINSHKPINYEEKRR